MDADGLCSVSCSFIDPNCGSCTGTTCDDCDSGYELFGNRCIKSCSPGSLCKDCSTELEQCVDCVSITSGLRQGHGLLPDENYSCTQKPCGINNCKRCEYDFSNSKN